MILFIDFDGVLHHNQAEAGEFFSCRPLLEGVLREFPDVDVVVSSSWRDMHSLAELRAFFSEDLRSRIVDVTSSSLRLAKAPNGAQREMQCTDWNRRKRCGSGWIALDDQAWRFNPASPNLLLTNGKTGITEADMQELRRRLRACLSVSEGAP
jgi:hypothetical protein